MNNKIKILGIDYNIQFSSRASCGDGDYIARIFYQDHLIKIDKDTSCQQKQEGLLHEILHALNEVLKLNFNEPTISRLSNALHCVMRDNPGFFIIKSDEKEHPKK